LKRRNFLKTSSILTGGFALTGFSLLKEEKIPFKISLAEWSLHRTLYSGKLDHLDFCKVAKNDFELDAVEYVNSFFFDKAQDQSYLKEMKQRADDLGVKSLLIMCDNEGNLGDPDPVARMKAVENHYKWIDAGKYLGCHSIRVNAQSEGTYDEQMKLAADGLNRLTEYGAINNINVIVENHGGLSSNGKWLSSVIEMVNHPHCGTLPDFGNFYLGTWEDKGDDWYDRYLGMEELIHYAKAVSAKSHNFNADGTEKDTDYYKMMKLVLNAGYHGYVGIEYEGNELDEMAGIQATKDLLEKVRDSL
jgi:sugar phosphate isomerase/epimerase